MPHSVFIIDDHPVVRLGLRTFLHHAGLSIVGEASSGEEALNDPNLLRADAILLDIRLSGMDGLETLQKIKDLRSQSRVLLFTGDDNPTYPARGMALGAEGIILKSDSLNSLLTAISIVMDGKDCWNKEQRRQATTGKRSKTTIPFSNIALTQREMDVLALLANGLTNKEIANSLGIGYETVKEHVQHVLRKICVSDRTQAAVWAVRNRVI